MLTGATAASTALSGPGHHEASPRSQSQSAPGRNRTYDRQIRRLLLDPLSYGGEAGIGPSARLGVLYPARRRWAAHFHMVFTGSVGRVHSQRIECKV